MQPQTKIATCCYCSSRTVLKLSARSGHELACGSCGAPLHNMKWLKTPEKAPAKRQQAATYAKPSKSKPSKPKHSKPKRIKRRKFDWKDKLEDVWDVIEDIFD